MKSPYLEDFLKNIGNSVHNINTICVGLAEIEKGNYTKPSEFTISWETNDNTSSARKARVYMLKSALIYIDDTISTYLKDIRDLSNNETLTTILSRSNPQFVDGLEVNFKKEQPELFKLYNSRNQFAKKEKEKDKLYKTLDSADRLRGLDFFFEMPKPYWIPMTILLNKWRNRVAHQSSMAQPEESELKILLSSEKELKETHSNIDINKTIEHFNQRKITLKDITTLIAISIKLIREIDHQIYKGIDNLKLIEGYIKSKKMVQEYNKIVNISNDDMRRRKFYRFIKTRITHLSDSDLAYVFNDIEIIE